MVSARQMANLLRLAEECSLRVVFSGDTKQILSVEAGDALRILEKESRLKTVALTQVQRQTRKEYRAAMEELRRNPERGFESSMRWGPFGRSVSLSEPQQSLTRMPSLQAKLSSSARLTTRLTE